MKSGIFREIDYKGVSNLPKDFSIHDHIILRFGCINVLVDKKDFELIKNKVWNIYTSISKNKMKYYFYHKRKSLHRALCECRKGYVVDHINGNSLDNRSLNLREASYSLNNYNRKRQRKIRGVKKINNKFVAKITFRYRVYKIGEFDDEVSAGVAYDACAYAIYKDVMMLNFPKKLNKNFNLKSIGIDLNKNVIIDSNSTLMKKCKVCKVDAFSKKYGLCKTHYDRFMYRANNFGISLDKFIKDKEWNSKNHPLVNKDTSIHKKKKQNETFVDSNDKCGFLVKDKFIKIDKEDWIKVSLLKWRFSTNGLLMNRLKNDTTYLWRLILNDNDAHTVQFKNGDKNDYRKENLQPISKSQMAGLAGKKQDDMTGVRLFKNGRWQASAYRNKRNYHIGYFDTKEEAIEARKIFLNDYLRRCVVSEK